MELIKDIWVFHDFSDGKKMGEERQENNELLTVRIVGGGGGSSIDTYITKTLILSLPLCMGMAGEDLYTFKYDRCKVTWLS